MLFYNGNCCLKMCNLTDMLYYNAGDRNLGLDGSNCFFKISFMTAYNIHVGIKKIPCQGVS